MKRYVLSYEKTHDRQTDDREEGVSRDSNKSEVGCLPKRFAPFRMSWDRTAVGWIVLFACLYAATRLINLTILPIFTDEAIYIRWSQIGTSDAAWRFISLTDGKQPLFTWFVMGFLRIFDDPLFAGRAVSVVSGAWTAIGIGALSWSLFRNRALAFVSVFLYIISPFSLMYDRLALYDSLVATLYVWNLYLSVLLVRTVRLDVALILGMVLGLGLLNKSSAYFSLALLPVTLILFDWHNKERAKRLSTWILYVCVAMVISQALYAVLRLSPFFHMIGLKNEVFIYPLGEWITHPFRFFVGNIRGLFDWATHYLTYPIFFSAVIAALTVNEKHKEKLLLVAYAFVPFVFLALFAKILYPRFILFMMMPLYVLASLTLVALYERIGNSFFRLVVFSLLFFASIRTDYYILTEPKYAPIPLSDRIGLIDDWPSGYGVNEALGILRRESRDTKIAVYTEGTFGLLPHAIEIYEKDNPNIKVTGIWPLSKTIPKEILDTSRKMKTFFILNESREPPAWPLELVAEFPKGTREDRFLRLYRVIEESGRTEP